MIVNEISVCFLAVSQQHRQNISIQSHWLLFSHASDRRTKLGTVSKWLVNADPDCIAMIIKFCTYINENELITLKVNIRTIWSIIVICLGLNIRQLQVFLDSWLVCFWQISDRMIQWLALFISMYTVNYYSSHFSSIDKNSSIIFPSVRNLTIYYLC